MRFTIRDLLWAMVVVALALGWWLDKRASEQRVSATVERILSDYSREASTEHRP